MIDAERDYTPEDVLTCDDAMSLAIIGYKVRAVDMGEGTFIDYNFAGWRINHAGGSSSGWSRRPRDDTMAWHVLPDEHYDAYKRVLAERDNEPPPVRVADLQKWGRALRPVPAEPPIVEVLDFTGVTTREQAEALSRRQWGLANRPAPAPNVGKWGKAAPSSDVSKWGSWGKPK